VSRRGNKDTIFCSSGRPLVARDTRHHPRSVRSISLCLGAGTPMNEQQPDWSPVTDREARVALRQPRYWGNPTGHFLRELVPGELCVIERSYVLVNTVDIGARCTLIRATGTSDLLMYSPLPLTPELKWSIDAIGTPRAVISPNLQHVDFVSSWNKYFPSMPNGCVTCTYLGPRGSVSKFQTSLLQESSPRQRVCLLCHLTPLLSAFVSSISLYFVPGALIFNETVTVHLPAALLCAATCVGTNQPLPMSLRAT
jgi:hypothetical protein